MLLQSIPKEGLERDVWGAQWLLWFTITVLRGHSIDIFSHGQVTNKEPQNQQGMRMELDTRQNSSSAPAHELWPEQSSLDHPGQDAKGSQYPKGTSERAPGSLWKQAVTQLLHFLSESS